MATFPDFVGKFPPVPMPVTLGEDTHHVFAQENDPLTDDMIRDFVQPSDPDEPDAFTEYVPCFAIDDTERFIALVWWKAGLLHYEYILATFDDKGQLIDRRVIAWTRVQDKHIYRAVATIDEDWVIYTAEGVSAASDDFLDPTSSKTYDLEIMPDGTIEG